MVLSNDGFRFQGVMKMRVQNLKPKDAVDLGVGESLVFSPNKRYYDGQPFGFKVLGLEPLEFYRVTEVCVDTRDTGELINVRFRLSRDGGSSLDGDLAEKYFGCTWFRKP